MLGRVDSGYLRGKLSTITSYLWTTELNFIYKETAFLIIGMSIDFSVFAGVQV